MDIQFPYIREVAVGASHIRENILLLNQRQLHKQ